MPVTKDNRERCMIRNSQESCLILYRFSILQGVTRIDSSSYKNWPIRSISPSQIVKGIMTGELR